MVVRNSLAAVAAVCILAAGTWQGMKWTATLTPMGTSKVAGTATVAAGTAPGTTVATIMITGGTAGTAYPWHVHSGKCDSKGGPVGGGASYKPVTAGADGKGTSTATLKMATPSSGDFHVNVHAADMSVIACGNLGMAGM
jgi:hypothetical protein